MVFPTQEYRSGLLSLGDFLDPGIESASPALAGGFFTTELPWKPILFIVSYMLGIPLEDSFLFGCAPWPMGILVPQTGIEPAPWAVSVTSPDRWAARESPRRSLHAFIIPFRNYNYRQNRSYQFHWRVKKTEAQWDCLICSRTHLSVQYKSVQVLGSEPRTADSAPLDWPSPILMRRKQMLRMAKSFILILWFQSSHALVYSILALRLT